jgi:imidazole glycerol-phosphate synthase subunit HisH
MIFIIDYGMGNLRSVQKAFERIKVPVKVVNDPCCLSEADKILLPGIGHFVQGMKNLEQSGFADAIKEAVLVKQIPILGICLGMQLMTNQSEEGDFSGLGFINAKTIKFPPGIGIKIPHMGWNSIKFLKNSDLTAGIQQDTLVYFVHSYFVQCLHSEDRLFTTDYGVSFDSAFHHQNIIGFQFHPEKSHIIGLNLLKNFAKL